ncbi:ABC transporter ATP-binding protein [Roseateles sp.]|uniref:ABC transporter ATP-binding protein n=1 Tax=Roseateles sp. TaxID=1971397 RepID=UPI003BA6F18B
MDASVIHRDEGLRISGLHKKHGQQAVIDGVDITLAAGEMLTLVGPSGCGKSSLLSLVAGLQQADAGEIHLNGRRIDALGPRERDVAMVFQNYALYPHMTVAENLGFPLEMQGWNKAKRSERVLEVAKLLQLQPLLERRPAQLSGGQRQRVAMGRALARHPQMFLFDEPLSNLDAQLRTEMRGEIKLLHQKLGRSAIYVTHDQVEAMTLGQRLAVMRAGRLQQMGTPQEVYQRPVNLFVAQFMAHAGLNLLPARWRADGSLSLQPAGAEAQDWTPAPGTLPPAQRLIGRSLLLAWRPELLRLSDAAQPSTPEALRLHALLRLSEPLGADCLLHLQWGEQRLLLRQPGWPDCQIGQGLAIQLPASGLLVFDAESGECLSASPSLS